MILRSFAVICDDYYIDHSALNILYLLRTSNYNEIFLITLLQNRPFVPVSQPGPPRRDKSPLLSRVREPRQMRAFGTPFGPGWYYQPGPKAPIFSVSFFLFLLGYFYFISIAFCIGI